MNFSFDGIEKLNYIMRTRLDIDILSDKHSFDDIWKIPLIYIDILIPTLLASILYSFIFLFSLRKEFSWEIILGGFILGVIYSYVLIFFMWVSIFPIISFQLTIYNIFLIALAMIVSIHIFIKMTYSILF